MIIKFSLQIITNRINLVIDKMIHQDQAGFLKNRYIAQNIMDLNCVLWEVNDKNHDAAIVAIDFKKAYDTVEWNAIYGLLEHCNFGPSIIKWIKLCYSDISSTVINNGYWSEFFSVARGLKQGDPLSCVLFNLIIEVIACKIRNNQKIEGIQIGTTTKKLGQYADDLWVSMKRKQECFDALLYELTEYFKFCGLQINYNKTEILRIGSLRDTNAKYFSQNPLHWSDGPIKILGIHITNNAQEMSEINYKELIQKTENICRVWGKRSLTLLGRIQIVNTLIIPIWLYRLQVLRTPSTDIFNKFKKVLLSFIWEEKRPKIAYQRLIRDYEQGGLKLADLQLKDSAIKIKWVQVYRFKTTLLDEVLSAVSPLKNKMFADCNINKHDMKRVKENNVFGDIWFAWAKFNAIRLTSVSQVLSQKLWFNSNIKNLGDMLYIKNWHEVGLNSIKDLIVGTRIATCQELIDKYGQAAINIIDYARVMKAIPKDWFKVIKHGIQTELEQEGCKIINEQIKCVKIVYCKLLDRMPALKSHKTYWENELVCEIIEQDWQNM